MDINETVTKEQALKLKELGFKEICLFGLNSELKVQTIKDSKDE